MPHIVVKMYPGRSEKLKDELSQRLAKSTAEVLEIPEGAVSVSVEEVPREAWEENVVKPDMLEKPELLYVKPDYLK